MLDQTTRLTILRLRSEGHGTRAIAHALGISRGAVKRVLVAGTDQVLPRALFETRFTVCAARRGVMAHRSGRGHLRVRERRSFSSTRSALSRGAEAR
jgi:IS30 family transposase